MNCSICDSDTIQYLFTFSKNRKIYGCTNCSVQFLHPQLDDDELNILYSENYYKAWGEKGSDFNNATRKMKKETFKLRISLIRRFILSGKVLDVGCASGYFLEVVQENGFIPYGVELSEYSSVLAKKMFGDDAVFKGILEDCSFDNHSFDVIAMSDLIEHVHSPVKTLTKARQLLKDEGVLMVMTPDTGSFSNKWMGKKWTHYKLEHFYYFNRKSFEMLADRCNLKIEYFEKSKKALNMDYLNNQFKVYKHGFFTPLVSFLYFILPKKLRTYNFYISTGEMVLLLKKKNN